MPISRLLIIGGTRFVGRAITEAARQRGIQVTLFHRGQSNPDLFADDDQVEHVLGDRNVGFDALAGRKWDAAVDACGYFPSDSGSAAKFLKSCVDRFCFISTISVYATSEDRLDENGPLLKMPEGVDPSVITPQTYGPLKVQCEEAVREHWGNEALLARAGLQIGPHDPTHRFSDWVERIGRRSEVLVPHDEDMLWQVLDTRDMAEYILDALERGEGGPVNLTGPVAKMSDCLELIRSTVNPTCQWVQADTQWLDSQGVQEWKELALWLRRSERGGFPLAVDSGLAASRGLRIRPLRDSIEDIWEAVQKLDANRDRPAGLAPSREDDLLRALSETVAKS